MEVVSQLFLALDEGYLEQTKWDEIASDAHVIASQLAALSKSLGREPRRSS